MVVEADFADRQHLRVGGECCNAGEILRLRVSAVLGMDADGGVDAVVSVGQREGPFAGRDRRAGVEDPGHALGLRPRDDGVEIVFKGGVV